MEDRIQSIERLFKILEKFRNYPDGVSLTDLSRDINIHKSTVFRFLNTLTDLGYIKKTKDNKYDLTYKMMSLFDYKFRKSDIIEIANPYLKYLSNQINEVVHLCVRDGIEVIYLDKIESNNSITLHSKVGMRSFLVNTSVGKAILSYADESEIREVWKQSPHKKITKNTIVDYEKFLDELEKIKKNKIAIDDEENEEGVYCIGTAILNLQGEVVGAISITGPKFRMKKKENKKVYELLLATAEKISKKLF